MSGPENAWGQLTVGSTGDSMYRLIFSLILFLTISSLNTALAQLPQGRMTSGVVELSTASYQEATFSFGHAVRDDPRNRITRNDWDILFTKKSDLRVCTVTDDRSTIVDLGDKQFDEIEKLPSLPPWTNRRTYPKAIAGHVYLIHTLDSDSDYMSLIRVIDVKPASIKMEWLHWIPIPLGEQLKLKEETKERLALLFEQSKLDHKGAEHKRIGDLKDPTNIILQIRTGAQGGHHSVLNLRREADGRYMKESDTELDFRTPPSKRDKPVSYSNGGYIPDGKALVVSAIDVFADARGDSNGHGEAILAVDNQELFKIGDKSGPFRQWFEGILVIESGDEPKVGIEVANSSAMDVRLKGKLIDLKDVGKIKPVAFTNKPAPPAVKRAGEGAKHKSMYLDPSKDLILQIQTGSQGGNQSMLTLNGENYRLDNGESEGELDFSEPVGTRETATFFLQGGNISIGKFLHITAVDVYANTAGDTNGNGYVNLKIGGQNLLTEKNGVGIRQWFEGSAIVAPGQEGGIRIAISGSSDVDVRIKAKLIDLSEFAKLERAPFKPGTPPIGTVRAGQNAKVAKQDGADVTNN